MPVTTTLAQAIAAGNLFAPGLSADQLRALPEADVTVDLSMMTMAKPGYSVPMIDGKTLLGSAIDAASAGAYSDVPVIVGATSADGFPFQTDKTEIFKGYGEHEAEARAIYDPSGDLPVVVMACPIRSIAHY